MNNTSFLYRSGDLYLPYKIRTFLETPIYGHYEKTKIYLTLWSIMHLLSGIITELSLKYYFNVLQFKFRLIFGLIIHTLWELWQIFIGMSNIDSLTGKNSIYDIIMDTLMFLIGMFTSNYSIKI